MPEEQHNCETPLKEFGHKVASNEKELHFVLKEGAKILKILAWGIALALIVVGIFFGAFAGHDFYCNYLSPNHCQTVSQP